MQQPHFFFLGDPGGGFSVFIIGFTTTCMVMTPPRSSPIGTLDSAKVLLFSKILPAFISFMSLIVLGPVPLSLGHWARMLSFKVATVVAGGYLLGPISVPSCSRNLSSNWSCPPAIVKTNNRTVFCLQTSTKSHPHLFWQAQTIYFQEYRKPNAANSKSFELTELSLIPLHNLFSLTAAIITAVKNLFAHLHVHVISA